MKVITYYLVRVINSHFEGVYIHLAPGCSNDKFFELSYILWINHSWNILNIWWKKILLNWRCWLLLIISWSILITICHKLNFLEALNSINKCLVCFHTLVKSLLLFLDKFERLVELWNDLIKELFQRISSTNHLGLFKELLEVLTFFHLNVESLTRCFDLPLVIIIR